MANITFDYPYTPYDEAHEDGYKYGFDWDESRQYLNGNYTYPIHFKTALPSVSKFKVWIKIWSRYTYVLTTNWDFFVYDATNGWHEAKSSFTLPTYYETEDTDYPYAADMEIEVEFTTPRNILKWCVIPYSRLSSGYTWANSYGMRKATITMDVPEVQFSDSDYFCGLQCKRYSSLYDEPKEVKANIGGNLVTATEVMVNIGGELVALPKMQICNFVATEKEQVKKFTFTAKRNGEHTIDAYDQYAGSENESYAYFKLCDSEMNEIMTYFTTWTSINLEAGKEYNLIVIDSPYYTDLAQRVIKVYST